MITRPMLAETIEVFEDISYPKIASPKLDGIRCLKVGGKALTRSFKPIPNRFIRTTIERIFPDGVDGEIMINGKSFSEGSSGDIMSEDGEPDFVFCLFDYVKDNLDKPYQKRLVDLATLAGLEYSRILITSVVNNADELRLLEDKYIEEGYEGIMVREPNGPYKCNRSTLKEGYLLKAKEFEHFEVRITSFLEQKTNENEKKKNDLGLSKRSTAKAGMKLAGTLGKFIAASMADVLNIKVGDQLKIGSGEGLTKKLRQDVWDNQDKYVGKIIRCKYQKKGAKDKPRFITFNGFRDERDM